MRIFSIYMVAGSMLLFLIAPLWGMISSDISQHYGWRFSYGLYLTMVPWLIHWSIAAVWLIKLTPKEGT